MVVKEEDIAVETSGDTYVCRGARPGEVTMEYAGNDANNPESFCCSAPATQRSAAHRRGPAAQQHLFESNGNPGFRFPIPRKTFVSMNRISRVYPVPYLVQDCFCTSSC